MTETTGVPKAKGPLIYRQSIWNAAYPDRGWRAMEDRGSSTANHYDHVHVSVSA